MCFSATSWAGSSATGTAMREATSTMPGVPWSRAPVGLAHHLRGVVVGAKCLGPLFPLDQGLAPGPQRLGLPCLAGDAFETGHAFEAKNRLSEPATAIIIPLALRRGLLLEMFHPRRKECFELGERSDRHELHLLER